MIENGFIKIHRSMLEWEWHDNEHMMSVFLHCLMLANWKEKRWHGQTIPRGSFVTSYEHLAKVTGIPRSTVYRCIQKLSETGEIETKTEHTFTLIKVRKYAEFQDFSEDTWNKSGTQMERKWNVSGTRVESTEESKNSKKVRNIKKNTKRKSKREEIIPEFWNPNPIRVENPIPATQEEIESVKAKLRGENHEAN